MTIQKGIAFPLQIDPIRGNLKVASEGELTKGHILSWLHTEVFERVMRPLYGLKDPLFNSIDAMSRITAEIESGLRQYVPTASFQVRGSINDQGQVVILIYWNYLNEEQAPISIIF